MKDFTAFKEALKDEALKKEYKAFLVDAGVKAVIDFAASKGFTVTMADLNGGAQELSLDDLDNVAGGQMFYWDPSDTASDRAKANFI